jgi:hypothetical protein
LGPANFGQAAGRPAVDNTARFSKDAASECTGAGAAGAARKTSVSTSRFGILPILIATVAIGASLLLARPLFAQDGTNLVARGRYLVNNVAMCGECHSPKLKNQPDRDHWLQGAQLHFHPGQPVPWFATYAPAIAGLPAGWSQAQVAHFLQTGTTPGGVPPRAPMPAYRMDRADAEAVAAYLHSLRQ